MKREHRKRIDQTREQRIYELWKTDIRQRKVKDIAETLDKQASMGITNQSRVMSRHGLDMGSSLNETSYQSLATRNSRLAIGDSALLAQGAKTLTMDLTQPKGVNQWTG